MNRVHTAQETNKLRFTNRDLIIVGMLHTIHRPPESDGQHYRSSQHGDFSRWYYHCTTVLLFHNRLHCCTDCSGVFLCTALSSRGQVQWLSVTVCLQSFQFYMWINSAVLGTDTTTVL